MKAIWNTAVIAECEDKEIITIEGNAYFPPTALMKEYFIKSDTHTTCPWKGLASYYTVVVDGINNPDAAWYYASPKEGSVERVGADFANYVAFWNGVEIVK
jgi:uncharacterized protein (DUF427 family)